MQDVKSACPAYGMHYNILVRTAIMLDSCFLSGLICDLFRCTMNGSFVATDILWSRQQQTRQLSAVPAASDNLEAAVAAAPSDVKLFRRLRGSRFIPFSLLVLLILFVVATILKLLLYLEFRKNDKAASTTARTNLQNAGKSARQRQKLSSRRTPFASAVSP